MAGLVEQAVGQLRAAGVSLEPALSEGELSRIEDQFNVRFGPEHRQFLQAALPIGASWPDWRNGAPEDLRERINWPIDGVVFDVHNNSFWPNSWGDRPDDHAARESLGRTYLTRVPRLVPLFSHRYLTADPECQPSPVFSVHQTDVIRYGDDLLDYVAHEFKIAPRHPSARPTYVPFWSDLAEGTESRDL